MPRSSIGNKRPRVSSSNMEKAVRAVIRKEISFSAALTTFSVCRTTLRRQLSAWKLSGETDVSTYEYFPHLDHKRVFTQEEEIALVDYATTVCHMMYGLTLKEFRALAFKYAEAKNKVVLENRVKLRLLLKLQKNLTNYHLQKPLAKRYQF